MRLTEAEYARLVADHGADTVRRYIDYVDESAQRTGNKNGWKDWNLTVRKAIREAWGGGARGTDLQQRKRILDEKIKRDMEAERNGDTGGNPQTGKAHLDLLPGGEGKSGG
ncbi:hypothetical protein [Papillibacter cinnamivorans]|uniref:hypothetical protein n=1 Tax=Papillibacter cinnamivorans TaxID=100176 RepID=UPI00117F1F8F|nr:hypothetical protein [Papillibacter cinnamivorans]